MASCITARDEFRPVRTSALLEMLHGRTEFCSAFLDVSLPPHIDQPWYTVRMDREWQEGEREETRGLDLYMPRWAMLE
jgi:hypothetical protein